MPVLYRWKQLLDENGQPITDEDGAAIVVYTDAALEGVPNDAGTRKRCPYCRKAGEFCLVCGGTSWVLM